MPRARWAGFSGGLWLPSDPDAGAVQADFAIPDNALLEATNVEFLDNGAVRGRRGSRNYNSFSLELPIRSMFKHYPRTGPRASGKSNCVGANQGASGTDWTDPGKTNARDGTYAYAALSLAGDASKGLLFLNPYSALDEVTDAPLSGIVVEIFRRAAPAGGIYDKTVQLWRDGALKGENRALTSIEWPTDWATIYYGGPGDKWGLDSLTVAQVNAPDFGLYLDVETQLTIQQAQVQYVAIHAFVDLELAATLIVASYDAGDEPRYDTRSDADGTFAPATAIGSLPAAYPPRFVTWQELDSTFVFDGANDVRRWDGREWSEDPPSEAKRGPYATLWRNRMWATDPAELSFSVYASGINDVESWPPAFQLSLADPRGGTITGLETDGDRLVCLKDSGVWTFKGDIEFGGVLTKIAEIGCVAPLSVVVLPQGVAYVSEDGVFLLPRGGLAPVELSRPIRAAFRGRQAGTKFTGAVAAYVRTRRQLWVKLAPDAGGAYVASYVPGAEGPTIAWAWVPDVDMNCATTLDGEADDSELLIGGADGWLRQYDTGADDRGTPIAIRVRTVAKQLGRMNEPGAIRRIYATGRTTGDLELGVRYDNATADAASATATLAAGPELRHPRVTLTNLGYQGRFASIFAESDGGPEFELHGIEADYALRTGFQWIA